MVWTGGPRLPMTVAELMAVNGTGSAVNDGPLPQCASGPVGFLPQPAARPMNAASPSAVTRPCRTSPPGANAAPDEKAPVVGIGRRAIRLTRRRAVTHHAH